jgi:class 3 adenylate cyclase/WD40 repeat protein
VTVVTFLFVDMVGSTDLLSSVGDLANDEIRKDIFEVLRRSLGVNGGTEVKYLGDGLMAVFPQLDDAVAAAIAMHQGVGDLDGERNFLPLALRVGISRGEATPDEGDWHGTAVVEAARLCALASPGQVLLTDRALEQSPSPARPVQSVGSLRLKGFPELVPCSEVVWTPTPAPRGVPLPPAFSLRDAPTFVGREPELEQLLEAWEAVTAGEGRSVLVSGPPQVGSSRLVAQLIDQLPTNQSHGRSTLILRGAARRGDASHAALIEALRWPVWWGDRQMWEAIQAVPGVSALMPTASTRFHLPSPDRGFADIDPPETAEVAERVLRAWSKTSTVMLVLEDLQWADAPALEAIANLVSTPIRGVLQVATFRAPETPDALIATRLVDKLQWSSHAVAIEVRPLGQLEVVDLLVGCDLEASVARRWAPEVSSRVGSMPGDVARAAKRVRRLGSFEPGAVRAALSLTAPYLGLVAYQESDAGVFFGRQEQVEWLVDRLRRDRFVVLVGASGSGKSSLLRAGIAPRMAAEGGWPRVISPALNRNVDSLQWPGLIIDQFEEIFSVLSGMDRDLFLDAVVDAVSAARDGDRGEADPPAARWVAIGLRADFYASCASDPRLARLVADHTVLVSSVSADDVRAMVGSPANAAGLAVETGLADIVIADVAGEPYPLPLVSQALHEAWRRRIGAKITIADYREAGGVRGAISVSAERVYTTELTDIEQATARSLLLRLIEVEGPGDRPSRRPVALIDIRDDSEMAVVDRLVAARLIVADDGTIALAHEALIEAWPRLDDWISEDRDRLVVARRLSRAAAEWEHAGRPETDLYRGGRLEAVLTLYAEGHAPPLDAAFIDASVAADERSRSSLVRTNRRLRRLLTGVAIAAVVSLIAGVIALSESRKASAERNRAVAELRSEQISRLASEAVSLAGSNIDLASLLAVEAYRLSQRPDTLSALETVLRAEPAVRRVIPISQLPPDATPLPGDPAGSIVLYKAGDNVIPVTVGTFRVGAAIHIPGASSGAIAPDGNTAAVTTVDGGLLSVDLRNGALTRRLAAPEPQCQVGFLSNDQVGLGCEGTEVVTGDLPTGNVVSRLLAPTPGFYFGFADSTVATDPTHQLIAVAPNTRYYPSTPLDLVSGTNLATMRHLILPVGGVTSLAFQPGGHLLAVGTADHGALLVDIHTGRQVGGIGPSHLTAYPVFSPDARYLAIGDNSGTVNVYNVTSARPLISPVTQTTSGTVVLRFDPNAGSLYELFGRQAIEIGLNGSQPLASAPFGTPGQGAGAMSPDGHLAYSTSLSANGGGVFTSIPYDPQTGRRLGSVRPGYLAYFSQDGRFAVGATANNRIETVTADNKLIALSHTLSVGLNQIGPNRSLTLLLSMAANQSSFTLEHLPDMRLLPMHLVPDGTTLVAGDLSDNGYLVARAGTTHVDPSSVRTIIDVARVENGRVIAQYETQPNSQAVTAVAFNPDDRSLAVGDAGGNIGLFNLLNDSFQPAIFAGLRGAVQQLLYAPDGRTLMASGADGTVWWWDTASHTPIGNPFPANLQGQNIGSNPAANIDPRFDWLLIASTDGLRLWNIDTGTWSEIACQRAGRNLTRTEWQHYMPTGVPYQEICPRLQT